MPLGKDRTGRTVGPSSAQRAVNAKRAARYPLRKVIDSGVGADPARPYGDVDVLECGHSLTGATDLVGRRYPDRRRCKKCSPRPCAHDERADFIDGTRRCLICDAELTRPVAGE